VRLTRERCDGAVGCGVVAGLIARIGGAARRSGSSTPPHRGGRRNAPDGSARRGAMAGTMRQRRPGLRRDAGGVSGGEWRAMALPRRALVVCAAIARLSPDAACNRTGNRRRGAAAVILPLIRRRGGPHGGGPGTLGCIVEYANAGRLANRTSAGDPTTTDRLASAMRCSHQTAFSSSSSSPTGSRTIKNRAKGVAYFTGTAGASVRSRARWTCHARCFGSIFGMKRLEGKSRLRRPGKFDLLLRLSGNSSGSGRRHCLPGSFCCFTKTYWRFHLALERFCREERP
jgi:hypothetical protein